MNKEMLLATEETYWLLYKSELYRFRCAWHGNHGCGFKCGLLGRGLIKTMGCVLSRFCGGCKGLPEAISYLEKINRQL